jgi:hypothetical protein
LGAISWLAPVPTHDCATWPCPVLQFLYQIAEASAQHASRSGATKQTAQSPWQQVAQASAGLSTSRRCTWLATEQPAQNIAEPATSIAGIYVAACG